MHDLNLYSVKLLHNIRGSDELEIVLNKTGKETDEKYKKLARFDLAIRFKIKPVIMFHLIKNNLFKIYIFYFSLWLILIANKS